MATELKCTYERRVFDSIKHTLLAVFEVATFSAKVLVFLAHELEPARVLFVGVAHEEAVQLHIWKESLELPHPLLFSVSHCEIEPLVIVKTLPAQRALLGTAALSTRRSIASF